MDRVLTLDETRCVGCFACVVACMDQNDCNPENDDPPFRRVYQMETRDSVRHVSTGCLHCSASPCLKACPVGAIFMDEKTKAVLVEQEKCIGCRLCAQACPFGVPRYDSEGKMRKCDLCNERIKVGLLPSCVKICPFGALQYGRINDLQAEKERRQCFRGQE